MNYDINGQLPSLIDGCDTLDKLRNSRSIYHQDILNPSRTIIIMPQGQDSDFIGFRGFYEDEIDISINHSYSDSADNPLAGMAKGLFNSIKTNSFMASDMLSRIQDMVGDGFPKWIEQVKDATGKIGNLGLVMATDRVSFFTGTEIRFNLSATTVYYNNSLVVNNSLLSVKDYINNYLLKTSVGKLTDLSGSIKEIVGDSADTEGMKDGENNDLFLIQYPPNNYDVKIGGDSNTGNSANVKGAWDILVNDKWLFINMKLNSVNVSPSKELHRDGNPLYITMKWEFEPAKAWTAVDLGLFLKTAGVRYSSSSGNSSDVNAAKVVYRDARD